LFSLIFGDDKVPRPNPRPNSGGLGRGRGQSAGNRGTGPAEDRELADHPRQPRWAWFWGLLVGWHGACWWACLGAVQEPDGGATCGEGMA